jgi:hypothetical protein
VVGERKKQRESMWSSSFSAFFLRFSLSLSLSLSWFHCKGLRHTIAIAKHCSALARRDEVSLEPKLRRAEKKKVAPAANLCDMAGDL